jgi:hypothetical protein
MDGHKRRREMGRSSSGWIAGAAEHGESRDWRNPRWPVIMKWVEWLGTATIFMSLGIVLAGIADRRPPFRVIESTVPAGVPGEKIVFESRVWRDTRPCSVTMYRSIHHSDGRRLDMDPQFFAPEDIATMERKTPGFMRPQIEIPPDAKPGADAYMSTRLRYVCNPYQVILPVDVHVIQPFSVIAP